MLESQQKRIAQLEEELKANKDIKKSLERMYGVRVAELEQELFALRSRLLNCTCSNNSTSSPSANTNSSSSSSLGSRGRRGVAGIAVSRPNTLLQLKQQQQQQNSTTTSSSSTEDLHKKIESNEAARGDAERVMMETMCSLDETKAELEKLKHENSLYVVQSNKIIEDLRKELESKELKYRVEVLDLKQQIAELKSQKRKDISSDDFVLLESTTVNENDELRRECLGLYKALMSLNKEHDQQQQGRNEILTIGPQRIKDLSHLISNSDTEKFINACSECSVRIKKVILALRGEQSQTSPSATTSPTMTKSVEKVIRTLLENVNYLELSTKESTGGDGISLAESVALLKKEITQLHEENDDLEALMRRTQTDIPYVKGLVQRFLDSENVEERRNAFDILADVLNFEADYKKKYIHLINKQINISLNPNPNPVAGIFSKIL